MFKHFHESLYVIKACDIFYLTSSQNQDHHLIIKNAIFITTPRFPPSIVSIIY